MRSYTPEHFKKEELVPPELQYLDWWEVLFDVKLLITLDMMRERYGPIIVNNWHVGGPLKYCGFRTSQCKEGAKYSQHRYGRAADLHFTKGLLAEDVREDILNAEFDSLFIHITSIEMGTPWLHIDVRNWDKIHNGILQIQAV